MNTDTKAALRSAVFLDRDGVINDHRRFVNGPDDFFLFPYAAKAIAALNHAHFFVAMVSNQGGVGLGYMTEGDLVQIHAKMIREIAVAGAHFDALSYCSHAPKAHCACRKPKPGQILNLAQRHTLDLGSSYMVGDRDVDIMAGQAAGCKTVLVGAARLPNDLRPDMHCPNLAAAVEWILSDALGAPLS